MKNQRVEVRDGLKQAKDLTVEKLQEKRGKVKKRIKNDNGDNIPDDLTKDDGSTVHQVYKSTRTKRKHQSFCRDGGDQYRHEQAHKKVSGGENSVHQVDKSNRNKGKSQSCAEVLQSFDQVYKRKKSKSSSCHQVTS